ncbi:MAG: precorrin-3B C(17)-methyltransferase [Alphaproteobacteria bacterium]
MSDGLEEHGRGTALVVLTPGGLALARRLAPRLPRARVHVSGRLQGMPADVRFTDLGCHVRDLFAGGTAIVGVCAAAILVRALAPLLADKDREPPVIALAEDGSHAIPLLGGHRGANRLALRIAEATGGAAAITTGGDVRLGVALDDPPAGWKVENPKAAKTVAAALLADKPVRLDVEAGDPGWLSAAKARWDTRASLAVRVSDRSGVPSEGELVLRPPTLAVGVGCERGTEPDELAGLVGRVLDAAGLARASVAVVASIELKADEPAVHAVAADLGAPARFFDAHRLEAETPRLENPSALVFAEVGCHGVAEAAALAAAGPDAKLVVAKTKAKRATCAVARAVAIDAGAVGRPRGRLWVVGTGPGAPAYRAPEADRVLGHATDVVGYGPYIDLLGPAARGLRQHAFALGEEQERCRKALELAAAGGAVVLVSSGDPGVFAMAALVFELLDGAGDKAWRRVGIEVVPGISAMQLAAARAGAPLGHDFCAISLSDLLTPWEDIERRLIAAAEGDFVIALYNPASRLRRGPLTAARDILAARRPADTPVVIARNLARGDESVEVVPMHAFDVSRVDMLTVVIVGNRRTRALRRGGRCWVYTPRGYATAAAGDDP